MGISFTPNLLLSKTKSETPGKRLISDIAKDSKAYRHPDSATISYPKVVEKPLGTIEKPLKVAIVGAGAAGIAALYELSALENSSKNINITLYESDPDHFLNRFSNEYFVQIHGLKAGRVSAAISSDEITDLSNCDHAVYEIGAMRFPEIAGLMWHYASTVFGGDKEVSAFPNPGTVPTELVHGDHVDRFAKGRWLNENSATKMVLQVIRNGLVGQPTGDNISLFPIGGMDPAKISAKLKCKDTDPTELEEISKQWKIFTQENDKFTLGTAVRKVIEAAHSKLPDVDGLTDTNEKISYYVELFGTVGFGTGGFKSVFNMSILETMRLLLWDYSNEYVLPVSANVDFLVNFYTKALSNNENITFKRARATDVCHLDGNENGQAMVVYYEVGKDGKELDEPHHEEFNYVILATTPKQTSAMTSKIGFDNSSARRVPLGDHGRKLEPEQYKGSVRPALVLSKKYDVPNSKLFSAINSVHMVCSSKIFATVKIADYNLIAPDFFEEGKIKAIVADCGLGSSYVVPPTIVSDKHRQMSKDYYSFLISYAWEGDSKGMQHNFGKYPLNIDDTKHLMDVVVGRTTRYVNDPESGKLKRWWFGEALSKLSLEDPLSYDWTTYRSAGAFKLNNAGDNYNSDLLFRYHTHALKPELGNRFFLANCSYSNLGGWLEGAFMSAVNAVCGLIVAANDGNVNALNVEARKVVQSFDNVVESD